MHIICSVDDGASQAGLKFHFEELAPGKTRVAFTIDDLTRGGIACGYASPVPFFPSCLPHAEEVVAAADEHFAAQLHFGADRQHRRKHDRR